MYPRNHLHVVAGVLVLIRGRQGDVLARLALITADAGVPSVRLDSRRGPIFWITASANTGLPRALERVQTQRYIVSPSDPGAKAIFRVAGCSAVARGRAARRAA